MKDDRMKIDIPVWSIVKVALVLVAFYLLFLIRDIIALFFIVLILVASFNPLINRWEKKIRRVPAVALLFLIVFLAVAAIIYLIVPPLVDQISQLIGHLPQYFNRYDQFKSYVPSFEKNLSTIARGLTDLSESFISITASFFGGIVTFLTSIVLTAYLLVDKEAFGNFILSLLPLRQKSSLTGLVDKIGQKLGAWLRGQVVLGVIIGVVDLIGLVIIGVPYALTLAVISGILEFVPTVGPIFAGVIAVAVALIEDPIKAILVLILYVAVQQLENNFIVPKIMQKAVGLSPVIIIFAILIGAKLYGIAGAILAVPLVASLSVIVQEWPSIKKTFDTNG